MTAVYNRLQPELLLIFNNKIKIKIKKRPISQCYRKWKEISGSAVLEDLRQNQMDSSLAYTPTFYRVSKKYALFILYFFHNPANSQKNNLLGRGDKRGLSALSVGVTSGIIQVNKA